MRDLEKYQSDYLNLPFEPQHVRYRKRTTVESLRRHHARRILEVGCGLDPIFMHFTEFETLDIIEPSKAFFVAADRAAKGLGNVRLHAGTLEAEAPRTDRSRFRFHPGEQPVARGRESARVALARTLPLRGAHHSPYHCSQCPVVASPARRRNGAHRQCLRAVDHPEDHATARHLRSGKLDRPCRGLRFSVIESGTFFVKPFTHAQMAELSERGFLTRQMLDGLYGLTRYLPEFGSEIFVNAGATAAIVDCPPKKKKKKKKKKPNRTYAGRSSCQKPVSTIATSFCFRR